MVSETAILKLSGRDIARQVGAGMLSAEAVTNAFLDHIAATDGPIAAWQHIDGENALAAARAIDARTQKGLLAGVPVGVKDVIDTVDMPTEYGSKAYRGNQPAWDAPSVTLTRAEGGVVLGKTVTTEFAMASPNQTRNPHNIGHTPGGSSSGSCAAVAAGMARMAFGTQTSGSIIRPSSYCGVVGFKPSFGKLNRTAVKVLADDLDTLGVITADVGDAAWCAAAVSGDPTLAQPAIDRPVVGLFRTSRWDQAEASAQAAVEQTAERLGRRGIEVRTIAVPDWFDDIFALQDAIMGWEVTQSLAFERLHRSDALSDVTRAFLAEKALATIDDYRDARRRLPDLRRRMEAHMNGVDALITLAAPGEAPAGMPTGDPLFNRAWSVLHMPCITVPATTGPTGLPVGVQMVGRREDDARLLAVALHVEAAWKGE